MSDGGLQFKSCGKISNLLANGTEDIQTRMKSMTLGNGLQIRHGNISILAPYRKGIHQYKV